MFACLLFYVTLQNSSLIQRNHNNSGGLTRHRWPLRRDASLSYHNCFDKKSCFFCDLIRKSTLINSSLQQVARCNKDQIFKRKEKLIEHPIDISYHVIESLFAPSYPTLSYHGFFFYLPCYTITSKCKVRQIIKDY